MFANTITLTIAGAAHVLNRVNQDAYGSEYSYAGATSSVEMKIRHSTDKIDADGVVHKRHNVYIERIIFPTATELTKKQTFTATLRGGKLEDPVLSKDLALAANTWLASGTILVDLAAGVN